MSKVTIDRELLERAVKADASVGASSVDLVDGWKAMAQIRAILAHLTQQGEAVEVVVWRSRLIDPPQNNPRCRLDYFQDNAPWVESEPLMTVSQHQRILADMRQQRDKLAGLLNLYRNEVVPDDLDERIDTALSELTP